MLDTHQRYIQQERYTQQGEYLVWGTYGVIPCHFGRDRGNALQWV